MAEADVVADVHMHTIFYCSWFDHHLKHRFKSNSSVLRLMQVTLIHTYNMNCVCNVKGETCLQIIHMKIHAYSRLTFVRLAA